MRRTYYVFVEILRGSEGAVISEVGYEEIGVVEASNPRAAARMALAERGLSFADVDADELWVIPASAVQIVDLSDLVGDD